MLTFSIRYIRLVHVFFSKFSFSPLNFLPFYLGAFVNIYLFVSSIGSRILYFYLFFSLMSFSICGVRNNFIESFPHHILV